jgi:integrase
LTSISTGLHIVRKRLKHGVRNYVYAWRGGPCILVQDGPRPAITQALIAKAYAARPQAVPRNTFDRVIDAYRASPDFAAKKPNTQREYRHRLDQISERFGKVPLRFFNGDQIRGKILEWRDEMADTPRAADRAVGMLSTLLNWARDRTEIRHNHAADIGHLHRVNRADMIWEARHWQAVKDVPGHIHRALVLASLTGLRQGDLLALTWEQVTPAYVATTTAKTGGEAVIPMHEELARFFTGPPWKGPILRNSRGEPWTASGFQSSWGNVKPKGFDRHFHDLRGTFVTRLCIAGFGDAEIANMIGWTGERVASIRARYVDRVRVAKARAERLGVNHAVNQGVG